MKKRITAFLLMLVIMISSSMTVLAAPKVMADGNVFDAVYYAQTYPQIAAAVGNTEAALYQHYLTYGKAEGKLPYAPGTVVTINSTATNSAAKTSKSVTTTAATTQTTTSVVYITNTGKKYHNAGCTSLRKSSIEISLADAQARGYTPCKLCH